MAAVFRGKRPVMSTVSAVSEFEEELRRKVGRSKNARRTVTLAGSVPDTRFADGRIRRDGRPSA